MNTGKEPYSPYECYTVLDDMGDQIPILVTTITLRDMKNSWRFDFWLLELYFAFLSQNAVCHLRISNA